MDVTAKVRDRCCNNTVSLHRLTSDPVDPIHTGSNRPHPQRTRLTRPHRTRLTPSRSDSVDSVPHRHTLPLPLPLPCLAFHAFLTFFIRPFTTPMCLLILGHQAAAACIRAQAMCAWRPSAYFHSCKHGVCWRSVGPLLVGPASPFWP